MLVITAAIPAISPGSVPSPVKVAEAAAEVVDSEVLAARSSATIAKKKAICLGSAHKVVAAVADALSAVAAVATVTIAKNPVTWPATVPRSAREDTVVDAAAAVVDIAAVAGMAAAAATAVVVAAAVAAAATRSVIDVKATVTWHATAQNDCHVGFRSELSASRLLIFLLSYVT